MNAWEIRTDGGIDALVATERPRPVPAARELVVRVRAVSLNYRDLLHVLGYADRDRWPLVPCSDGAGEVVAVGRDVTRFRVGDRVAGTFFQGWDAGPITADVMETALGGRLQGMLAEHALLREEGAVRCCPAELRAGRDAALRGPHRLERAGVAGPTRGGRDGAGSRHGRGVAVRAADREAARRARHPHLEQRRQAGGRASAPTRPSTTAITPTGRSACSTSRPGAAWTTWSRSAARARSRSR
jgi:hypothetical protein